MLGRTHLITGAAAALAVAAATGEIDRTPLAAYGLAAFSALLPDLDQRHALALRFAPTRLVSPFLRHLRHRQETHSILGTIVFAALVWSAWTGLSQAYGPLPAALWWAPVAGWVSHIVADMFNKQGVGLLAPFGRGPLEWISVPLPRALRISTIYDPKGLPVTIGRIQARIHTERVFFLWPVYGLMAWVVWHHGEALVAAVRADVWRLVEVLPGPARSIAEIALR